MTLKQILIKSLLSIGLLLFMFTSAHAQMKGSVNFLDFQKKPYYFGITLAYNASKYQILHGESFILNDSIRIVEGERGPGFNLGIVTNLKLGKHFDLRFLPTLSFSDRSLTYQRTNDQVVTKRIESVYVEAPFHIRYKSAPYKDVRVFVVGGVKYSYDVASNSRARQAKELVTVSPSDLSLEYGVGVQFFFPYFIFSPELKFSHGLNNILSYDDDLIYSSVLEKLFSRTFTVSFHFEG